MERPIKKSDRQPKANTDNDSSNLDSTPPIETKSAEAKPLPSKSNSDRSSDRSSGRGKKSSYGEETVQRVNPALTRGPKPVKPKAEVIPDPELETTSDTESENISNTSQT
ncbi:hypothetical protein TUMEXPCC7403_02475 [Tumidithrix helvetica PCC 7403]|uniref:hypothetical protein n=1 Tax=Tumidithrix helvetica TaxID=3457545 RepID=UPI003C9FE450